MDTKDTLTAELLKHVRKITLLVGIDAFGRKHKKRPQQHSFRKQHSQQPTPKATAHYVCVRCVRGGKDGGHKAPAHTDSAEKNLY